MKKCIVALALVISLAACASKAPPLSEEEAVEDDYYWSLQCYQHVEAGEPEKCPETEEQK